MRRLVGLVMFSVGFGMALMMFLPIRISVLIIIAVLTILGYNLFAC